MSNINERLQRRIFGAIASLVGGVTNNFAQAEQNRKNREFQQQENQKDRDFNAEQAKLSRDWQERMYTQYDSPQAQVNQRLAAGLNPSDGVTSQSVGSSSTASSQGSPLPPGKAPSANFLAEMPMFVEQVKNLKADTAKKKQEVETEKNRTRTEWFNSLIAETNSDNQKSIIDANLALLKTQIEKGGAEAKEAKERYAMLKEFRDSGGNTFKDESDFKQSESFRNNATAIRTQLLSLPQKQRIESETKLNNLAYELEDTYGRRIKSAMAQSSESELEKLKIDLREYIANSKIRRELVSIGLEDAKAELLEKQLSNVIESIDVNTLRSIVGDGSDPRSVFYGIFKKFFADMP